MSRLAVRFQALAAHSKKALVTFVTAGDPHPGFTVPLLHQMCAAGADVLELGVPFSDPMADGPAIQLGNDRALAHGISLSQVLDMVSAFRRKDDETPIVLMGYLNPIEVMGYEQVMDRASSAGVDGFIVVDMPPEEAAELHAAAVAKGIDLIFLVAPTSGATRVRRICELASGFIYYVSLRGVTGAGHLDVDEVAQKVAEVKQYTNLPVGVGFGISDGASAARVARVSDAVVVGSALVNRIAAGADGHADGLSDSKKDAATAAAVVALVREIRVALDEPAGRI